MEDAEIMDALNSYYREDMHYESGRILSSMYTAPPEVVLSSFFRFYQANLGNPGLYPGTVKMEREVVRFMGKLTGNSSPFGHVVSGGTEANITALWAARKMGFRRILTTEDVHFSVIKAADLLGMPVEYVPMRGFVMDTLALEDMIHDGDVVVPTAGTTPLGYIDPISRIDSICAELSCHLHVDAAFGGFVIPFLPENIDFAFTVPSVKTVTIDPHKMGFAPYPAGGILARENIFERIRVDAPYLIDGKSETLLGTRQSGSVAASYAAILHFGMDGYRDSVTELMKRTKYLVNRARECGFEILTRPVMNIANIVVDNVECVKKELLKRGWAVSANPKYSSLRIVVMPHVRKEIIDEFLKELKKVYG